MVLRFRIAVVLVWIAVAGAGVYATTSLPPLLSNSFGPGNGLAIRNETSGATKK